MFADAFNDSLRKELLIFTVGSDSAGLNLQSLGDALILRALADRLRV